MAEPSDRNLTLQQVATILQVEASTVRFWEKEFIQFLNVNSKKGQHKRFSSKNLEVFGQIKELLYTEQYTIKGAQRKMEMERTLAGGLGIESNFKTTIFFMFSAIMRELQACRKENEKLAEQVRKLREEITRAEEQALEAKNKGFLDLLKDKMQVKKISEREDA
ncbi:MerR family transcriptional regulator [Phosphitispora sp. TUW77]|uniref:MerR family transcriptional regulator n=1 Tax=Phosphitispora sp. TUW77 TaxID=3152361 RepID=UPI003AB20ACF